MPSITSWTRAGLVAGIITAATPALAVEINTIDPSFTAFGSWFEADMRGAGTASIVDLTGQGGDLENNQPLPTGAALLTTGADNGDKAEIGVADDYGTASTIIPTLNLGYGFHKVTSGNTFAAPSIKLSFYNADYDGDGFGTLVYEPTWNGTPAGSSTTPTADAWVDVAIDGDNGLFWWTGGFGQPNTAGGPPLHTLNGWAALFDPEFGDALLTVVSVGVGTSNQDQIGYFDNVRIAFGDSYDVTYDFEAASVPEPATLALFGLGLAGLGVMRRRRRC